MAGLSMMTRREVTLKMAEKYRTAPKKMRGVLLNEIVELCGYTRKHASRVLVSHSRQLDLDTATKIIKSEKSRRSARTRERGIIYDDDVQKSLTKIWALLGYICGKRLVPALSEMIGVLEKKKELRLSSSIKEKLLKISSATADRVLRKERKKFLVRGISHTKPNILINARVPIRTFSEWKDIKPGYMHMDSVGHDGGNVRGDFCLSLNARDVTTLWTVTQGVLNKSQKWTFEAIQNLQDRVPFPIYGYHFDNGKEFMNDRFISYCESQKNLEYTRGRSGKKNDNPYVEQRNYEVVRKQVGYARYEGEEDQKLLSDIYRSRNLLDNFFIPSQRLLSKERVGSKVIKKFDAPRTPYQRVLESSVISRKEKAILSKFYNWLNPANIRRKLNQKTMRLFRRASKRAGNISFFRLPARREKRKRRNAA